jgi:hypothetical protein
MHESLTPLSPITHDPPRWKVLQHIFKNLLPLEEVVMPCMQCNACPADAYGGKGGDVPLCEFCWHQYRNSRNNKKGRGEQRKAAGPATTPTGGDSDTDVSDSESDLSSMGNEEEPDTCTCCWKEDRVLRTAVDCCQFPVCADCLRDTGYGRFCRDCHAGDGDMG